MQLAKVLSERFKGMREAAGMSQQDVAMKAELSLSQVAKLEQGKKADPRVSTLLALASALGVKPGQIIDDLPTEFEEEAPKKKVKKQKKAGKKKKKKPAIVPAESAVAPS